MVHRNAPLSETGRLRLARCVVEDGWSVHRAAERFQVSVACLRENGVAAADDAFGSIYALDLPAEELAIAATEALGL
jgi:hypothetical protein